MESQDHQKLLGRFALERRLGSGGMSTVYLGRDEVLSRPVAVKLLRGGPQGDSDDDTASRFRREGRTAARLSHVNIVPVYDAGETLLVRPELPNGEPTEVSYIVMEYVPGGDLNGLIAERGTLDDDEVCRLGGGAADALAHAHGRGVVHRDVKPHNILIDPSGRPKLTDFGIARALGLDAPTHATRTGHYLGTALYSAPEQLRGEKVSGKTDVYALGVTLYQAVTGRLPFQGTMMEVAQEHLNEIPVPPHHRVPDMNRRLSETISSCLAKDPEERPTAEELSGILLDLSGGRSENNLLSPSGAPKQGPRERDQNDVAPAAVAMGPAASNGQSGRNAPANATGEGRRSRGVLALVGIVVVSLVAALGGIMAFESMRANSGTEEASGENIPAAATEDQGAAVEPADGDGSGDPGGSGGNPVDPAASAVVEETTEPVVEETSAASATSETTGGAGDAAGPDEAAVDAVRLLYSSAASGDYETSYGILTDEMKQTVAPTQAQWSGQFSTLESLTFEEEPEVEVSGGVATVSGVTRAEHTDRTELNTAVWNLVMVDGSWRLDSQSILDRRLV